MLFQFQHGQLVRDREHEFTYGFVLSIEWVRLPGGGLVPQMITFQNEEGHQFVRPANTIMPVTRH